MPLSPVSLLTPKLRSPFLAREVRRKTFPTGGERDRMNTLANLINQEIRRNPNRHVFQVLQSIRSSRPPQLEPSDYDAIENLQKTYQTAKHKISAAGIAQGETEKETEIPFANFAYQSLIWAVRSWPKRDVHCHVGPSLLPEEYVFGQIQRAKGTDREEVIRAKLEYRLSPQAPKQLDDKKKGHELAKLLLDTGDWGEITPDKISKIFNNAELSGLNDATQLLNIDLDDFALSVRLAIRAYFEDGVTEVHLGFVPIRRAPTKKDQEYFPIKELLKKVEQAVEEEEREAEKRFGIKPRVYFIFDFDRSNKEQTPEVVHAAVEELCRLKTGGESFSGRMLGIDLANTENPPYPENSAFIESIRLAIKSRFQFASHLGDPNQAKKRSTDDHLDYFRRAIEAIGGVRGWQVGHAKILANPIRRKKEIEWLSPEQQATVDDLLTVMQGNNIGIQSCPPSATNIENLLRHPIFYWMQKGLWNISLGVDGVYYSEGRSLSQWVANILLASDESVTVSSVRQMVDHNLEEARAFWGR